MTLMIFRCLNRVCLALAIGLVPTLVIADNHATGSYAIVGNDGQTLLALDIVETNGQISGAGVVPEGGLAQGPGMVEIRYGARLGDDLQLILQLDPHDPSMPVVGARVTVRDASTIRMLHSGRVIDGTFESIAAGSVTVPDAPPEPEVVVKAPEPEPAPEPAPEIVETVPQPEIIALPPSCEELDRVTAQANAEGGTDVVQEISSIYTLYGLSFGGEQTEAKCRGALQEVTRFLADMNAGDEAEACYAVEGAVEQIARKLRETGNPPSQRPDEIMFDAGMFNEEFSPNGINTADTCAKALTGLYAYLDAIQPVAVEPDTPDSFDLPAGYRVEPLVNLNLAGSWEISAGGEQMALWSQGRSEVSYEKGPDQRRVIWFWDPRDALKDAGVTRGTLFIEGTRDRRDFAGEARHYVAGCGVYVFPVTGTVRDRETDIRLSGERPDVDANCNITGVVERDFRLRFVADNPQGEANLNREGNNNRGASNGAANTPNFGVWALSYEVRNIDRGGALNVRRNPATNAQIVGELPYDAKDIAILGEGCTPVIDQVAFDDMKRRERIRTLADRWCRVSWNGQSGWVYGRYLRPM